jgi:hypothetical protein
MNNIRLTITLVLWTLSLAPQLASAGCPETFPRLSGKTVDHAQALGEIKTIVTLLTEKAPDKKGSLSRVLQAMSPGRMPTEDTVAALEKRLLEAVVRLKSEDLVGTDPAFQKAVGLIRAWDAEYPPELVQPRTTGLFAVLADRDLSQEEIQKFNHEIKEEHAEWVANIQAEADGGSGNPVRSRLRRRADDGQILQPIDSVARDVVTTPDERRQPSGSNR